MDLDLSDVLIRLLAAAAAGGLVGLNRDLADKPIGVRTLGLVSLGAATVGVAGIQVQGMAENPDALSRVVQGVIQGVMAGISFIGAGVILRNVETRNVEGLTTAATVWVCGSPWRGLRSRGLAHDRDCDPGDAGDAVRHRLDRPAYEAEPER